MRSEDFIQDRADVKAAIAETAEGFDIQIEVDALAAGEHTIRIYVIDENDGLVDTTFELPFTKEAAPEKVEPAPDPAEPVEEPAAEPAEEPAAEPEAPAAEEPADAPATEPEPPAPAPEPAKSGCGSMIGGSVIVLAAVLGSAWVSKRR